MLGGKACPISLLKEVVIEPSVKLECVYKFCYSGDTFGAGGRMDVMYNVTDTISWRGHHDRVMQLN